MVLEAEIRMGRHYSFRRAADEAFIKMVDVTLHNARWRVDVGFAPHGSNTLPGRILAMILDEGPFKTSEDFARGQAALERVFAECDSNPVSLPPLEIDVPEVRAEPGEYAAP